MRVSKGVQKEPYDIFLYGVPGIGKSTFAADMPNPVFIDFEEGTGHLDVARINVDSFDDGMTALDSLDGYETIVVDGLGRLEDSIGAKACIGTKYKQIGDIPYGRGPHAALDYWRLFLSKLYALRRTKRVNLCFLGHQQLKKVKNPLAADYERYVPKLDELAAGFLREQVSYVLFAKFETFTQKSDEDKRVRGVSNGARILHTAWNVAFDAKNRGDLPAELPLSWEKFEEAVRLGGSAEKIRTEILELAPKLPDDVRAKVQAAMEKAKSAAELAKILDKVKGIVLTNGGVNP